jgi:hypothetical protein
MVSFTDSDAARVVAGEITVTWRLWKYAHVKAGRVYGLGTGSIEVGEVKAVRVAEVSDADARDVGLPDAESLIERTSSHTGREVTPDTILYRVQFSYRPQPVERPRLSIPEIAQRLDRLDASSPVGPWTVAILRLIEENPGRVARKLAVELSLPTVYFKTNVRKLKALGLTVSLPVGYELSEVGQTYLDSLDD